jgi:multiple sugar transport system substrate-binding protein
MFPSSGRRLSKSIDEKRYILDFPDWQHDNAFKFSTRELKKEERMNKRIAILSLFLLLPLLVFAAGLKGTLTVWGCFTELQKPLEKATQIFETENPEMKVEVLVFDLRDFEAKVAATAPVGQAADIIVMDHSLTARYAKANILATAPDDLQKWVNTPGRYLPIVPGKASFEGKVVGMPFFGGMPALFYNKDYFAEAGLKQPPKTVSEIYADALKLRKTDASGNLTRAGYSIRLTGPTGGTQKFAFLSNQTLGQDVVVDGKTPGTYHANMDNEETAKMLQYYAKLLHGKDKSDDWALKHDAEGFAAGEVAMFMRESWVVPLMKDKGPKINYDIAYQPRDKFWRIYDWSVNACVPDSGKQKAAAWEFTKVMQRKEVMEVLFTDSGWIPARRDIVFKEVLADEPRFKVFIDYPKGAEIYFESNTSGYTEIWTKAGEILQAGFRDAGLASSLPACRAVAKKANDTANDILKSVDEFGM